MTQIENKLMPVSDIVAHLRTAYLDADTARADKLEKTRIKHKLYTEKGWANRLHYLHHLAQEFDIEFFKVLLCAQVMGESEDFDGLVEFLNNKGESL